MKTFQPSRDVRSDLLSRCLARLSLVASLAGLSLMGGCAALPVPKPSATVGAPAAVAVPAALEQLLARAALKRGMPAFMARYFPQSVMVAPVLDADSQQQTMASVNMRRLLVQGIESADGGFVSRRFDGAGSLDMRLDASLKAAVTSGGARSREDYVLSMTLTDLRSGERVAQSEALVRDSALDTTPTAFFRDSPVALPAASRVLKPDPLATPERQTAVLGRLDEADKAYETGEFAQALQLYRDALSLPAGKSLRAQIGEYLALLKLGREDDAQAAFARIVTLGLQSRSLGVKLLFAPGTTDYWPDPVISKPYAGWVREIARQVQAGEGCMQIVGHTSRTGAETFNMDLSEKRAAALRQQLQANQPQLASRLSIAGVGWSDNLVGTGTDDLRDALDRRVEFKVVDCAR